MNTLCKSLLFIFVLLSFSPVASQAEEGNTTYWIYTYSSELQDYQINGVENDELVINNGNWDVKIPLDELELIALPPKPGTLGQLIGGGLGGYCGGVVGLVLGFITWGVTGAHENGGFIVVGGALGGAIAGAYYGRRCGGNLLKGPPETLVDMAMWTLDEKKEWIQNSLINSY